MAVIYVDETNGDNTNNTGLAPTDAFTLIQTALDAASAGDIVQVLWDGSQNPAVYQQSLTMSTRDVWLRGGGRYGRTRIAPSSSGSPAINITGDGCRVSGFEVRSAAGGTDNGITVDATDVWLHDLDINTCTNRGILFNTGANNCRANDLLIFDCGAEGIRCFASTGNLVLQDVRVLGGATGPTDGISMSGTGDVSYFLIRCFVAGTSAAGFEIDSDEGYFLDCAAINCGDNWQITGADNARLSSDKNTQESILAAMQSMMASRGR